MNKLLLLIWPLQIGHLMGTFDQTPTDGLVVPPPRIKVDAFRAFYCSGIAQTFVWK